MHLLHSIKTPTTTKLKLVRYFIAFIFLAFLSNNLKAQKGFIFQPASGIGPSVMNPSGSGYISSTGRAWTGSTDDNDFELSMIKLPVVTREPSGDIATGSSGGLTDIVSNSASDSKSSVYVIRRDVGGVSYLMVRFRLGGNATSSKGFSLLMDMNNDVSGPSTDKNPGFEREIVFQSGSANQIVVNRLSGSTVTQLATYSGSTYSQKSIAASTEGSDADYFYDFFIPLSILSSTDGYSAATITRFAAVTITSASSGVTGTVADVNGINGAPYGNNTGAQLKAYIAAFPTGVSLNDLTTSNLTALNGGVTLAPGITSAPTSSSTSVSGTNLESESTTIYLYKNGSGTSFANTTVTGSTWTISGLTLAQGDILTAKAQVSGKSLSEASNSVTVSGVSACYIDAPVINDATFNNSGTSGQTVSISWSPPAGQSIPNNTSAFVQLYTVTSALAASSNYTEVGVGTQYISTTGSVVYQISSASNAVKGTFAAKVTFNGCTSDYSAIVKTGSSEVITTAPSIVASSKPIYPSTTSIQYRNNHASAVDVLLYVNGVVKSTASNIASGSNATFSVSGLNIGELIYARADGRASTEVLSNRSAIDTVKSNIVSDAPIISGTYNSASTTVSGTSTEAPGTTIYLYKASTTQIGTTTVDAYGGWSIGSLTLAANDVLTARALAVGENLSLASSSVTVGAAPPPAPAIAASFTVPYGQSTINITGANTGMVAGDSVRVYVDGTFIQSQRFASVPASTWSVSISAREVYRGAKVSASLVRSGIEGPRSSEITVSGATRFSITDENNSTTFTTKTAGVSFPYKINALNVNTAVTTFTGSVIVSSTSAIGRFGGTRTPTFSSGVASDSLNLTTAGNNQTFRVISVDDPSIFGDATLGVIQPNVKFQLAFDATGQPSSATAGSSIGSIKVNIQDQYGNTTTDSDQIQLSIQANTGTSGAKIFNTSNSSFGNPTVAASSGVATFTGYSVDLVGNNYKLVANTVPAGLTTSTASNSFSITGPSTVSKIGFTVQPTNTTAGGTISSVKVAFQDQFGNTVTSATGNITIAIGNDPNTPGSTLSGTLTVAAVNGEATFSTISINKVGTGFTLQASGSTFTATSSEFNITSGPASYFKVTKTVAGNATAGTGFAFSVTAYDASGNVANVYAGNKSIIFSGASKAPDSTAAKVSSTNFGSATTLNFTNGVATGTMTLYKVETANIVATEGSITTTGTDRMEVTVETSATKLGFTASPSNTNAGSTLADVKVRVYDAYDNFVSTSTASITLALSGGVTANGTLTASAVAGEATFSGLSVNTAGTYTFAASSGVLTGATSSSFTISAASANKLSFSASPSSTTAGATLSNVKVKVLDQYDNQVTSSTASITIALSGGVTANGTLTADAVAGEATFSGLSVNTAGTYTFGASSSGLTGATSSSFTISAASANKLEVTASPSNTNVSTTLTEVRVRVLDQYDNLVNSAASISLATTPSVTLGGTTTKSASAGVAVFDNLTITTVGTYTITASSNGLTSANTSSFTISAGTPSKFKITRASGSGDITAGNSVNITVTAYDAFDNIASSYTGSKVLTFSGADSSSNGNKPTADGTAFGTSTTLTFSNGAVTIPFVLYKAQTASIAATDATISTATNDKLSLTVVSGTANKFNLYDLYPLHPTAGINHSIIYVGLIDTYGNAAKATSNTIFKLQFKLSNVNRSDMVRLFPNQTEITEVKDTIKTNNTFVAVNYLKFKTSTINTSVIPYVYEHTATLEASEETSLGISNGTSSNFMIVQGNIYWPTGTGNWDVVRWNKSIDGGETFTEIANPPATLDPFDIIKIPTGITTTLTSSKLVYSMIIDGRFELATGGTLTLDHTTDDASDYNIHTHGTFANTGGRFKNNGISQGYLPNFHGGIYSHEIDGDTIITALWSDRNGALSTVKVTGITNTAITGGLNQSFQNFEWNNENQTVLQELNGNTTIRGLFDFKKGKFGVGSKELTLSGTMNSLTGNVKLTGHSNGRLNINLTSGSPTLQFEDASVLRKLTLNTDATLISNSTSISVDSLVLTKGKIKNTSNSILTITSNGKIIGASSTSYVIGKLVRTIPVSSDSYTFPIGDDSNYAPATVNFVGRTGADIKLLASTTALSDVSEISNSGLSNAKYLPRKWDIEPVNDATGLFSSYGVEFDYASDTFVGSVNTSLLTVRKKSAGGQWKAGAIRSKNSTKISANSFNSFSTFYIGESTGITSKFVFSNNTSITANGVATYTVARLDVAEDTVKTGSNTVYLYSNGGKFYSDAGKTNEITSIDITNGNGTATFYYSHTVAGDYTITGSEAANIANVNSTTISNATDAISVVAGTATKLVLLLPGESLTSSGKTGTYNSISSGASFTATVKAVDNYWNVDLTSTATVKFETNDLAAVTPGNITLTAGSGTQSFTMKTATNSATITALDAAGTPTLTSSVSTTFVVGTALPSKLDITSAPTSATAGVNLDPITVDILDAYGNKTNSSSNVTLALSGAPAGVTLGGTLTVAASSGTATFSNINIDKVGTYKLVATSGSLTADTTANISISVAAAAKLDITSAPASATAGDNLTSITVDILDAFGNKTASSSNVTLALSGAPAGVTLGGTLTVAASSGTATFSNINIDKVGTYKLVATSGSLTADTTANISISVAAAAKLDITSAPASATAGDNLTSITVDILDAFGNKTTSSSNVTLALSGAPAGVTLGGTLTVAASSGTATFSNINIDKVGTYKLVATSGSLTADTTANISISVAAAAKLDITSAPASATAGDNLTSITVDILDAFGNKTTSSSNVTLALSGAPAGVTLGGTLTVAASSGTATFSNINIDKVGTYKLVATSGSLTADTTANISISVAAAAKLDITSAPASATAGDNLTSITVDILDAFGNKTTSSSNVTLALSGAPAGVTLGGTLTVAASSGTATFSNINIDKVGTYKLVATSGSLTADTTANISIANGGDYQLAITTEPSNTTAGANFSIAAKVVDANGNTTGSSAAVSVSIKGSPSGVTLGGTTNALASSGLVSFSDLNITKAGTYQLIISSGSLQNDTTVSITISPATAAKLAITTAPTSGTAGATLGTLTVEIQDTYGNKTTDVSAVSLAFQAVNGATLGGTTSANASAGAVSFTNLTINKTGTYNLIASSGSLQNDTTVSITISPATAAKLAITTAPTSGIAGATLGTLTVEIQDTYGNKTTDVSAVSLAFQAANGATLGGTTSANASAGAVSFTNLTINKTGTYNLIASSGSLTTDTTANISITNGGDYQLVITTEPSNTTAGANFSIAAKVVDASGNTTSSTASVSVSIKGSPSGVTLGGTTTASASSGLVSFSDLNITKAGTYQLIISSGSLQKDTTVSITISPATAAKLAITTAPTSGIAGATLGTLTVEIQDTYGNKTTDVSAVSLAFQAANGATLGGTTSANASAGAVSFTNLTINKTGTYNLIASSGSLTTDTTANISITNGGDYQLVITTEPSNTTAGANFSIAAKVVDASGNTTSSTTSVSVSIKGSPSGVTLGGTTNALASSGLVSFSDLNITKAGTYQLIISSGSLQNDTTVSITISPATAAKLAITTAPTSGIAGATLGTLTVEIQDTYGNKTTDVSAVSLTFQAANGATLGGTTSANASAGAVSFTNLTINKTGTYNLIASSGSLTTDTTANISITNGGDYQLVITTEPSNTTAGANFSIAAKVVDASGNTTSSTASVSVSIKGSPSGVTLGGTTTASASSGLVSFSDLNITKAGTYQLIISSGSLQNDITVSITISPATAAKLAITTAPTSGIAGATLGTLTVEIQDTYGNKTTDVSAVSLALQAANGATLGGTTSANASAGAVSFTNLTINKTGTYNLIASSGSLTTDTTANISITNGGDYQLVITTEPSNTTAGANFSIAAKVVDASGNTTSSTASVSVSIKGSPSGVTLGGTTNALASSGLVSFSDLNITKAGTYQLIISSGSLQKDTTVSITISPAEINHVSITRQVPTTTKAGNIMANSLEAELHDIYENTVTTSTSKMKISVTGNSKAAVGFSNSADSVSIQDGKFVFTNLKIEKVGNYTFSLNYQTLTKTSSIFNIIPNVANELVITTQPSQSALLNSTIGNVVVKVSDAFGNLVDTSLTVSASIAGAPSGVTLGGTVSKNTSNGAVTFNDLTINTVGDYKLVFASGSVIKDTTNNINVYTNNLASQFELIGTNTQTAGSSQTVTIKAQNSSGDVDPTYSGTKTLTFTSSLNQANITNVPKVNTTGISSTINVVFTDGLATIDLALFKAGVDTIKVSEGSKSTTAAKALRVVVGHGAFDRLAISLSSPQTVGTAFTGTNTLTALDAYGNTVTNFNAANNPITVAGNQGSTISGLSGGSILNSASDFVNGVANLTSLGFKFTGTAGSVTFTFTPAAGSATTSSAININPNQTINKFIIVGNSVQEAGEAQNIQIIAKDIANNTVTGYTSTRTMVFDGAIESPNKLYKPSIIVGTDTTIFGRATTLNFVNGIASAKLLLYRAGVDSLTVADFVQINRSKLKPLNPTLFISTSTDIFKVQVVNSDFYTIELVLSGTISNGVPISGNNKLYAKDKFGNNVIDFNAASTPVILTAPAGINISGLSGGNMLVNVSDFVNGVADLSALGLVISGPTACFDLVVTPQGGQPIVQQNLEIVVLDNDGDGTPDANDPEPNNPCVWDNNFRTETPTETWRNADCDGDGIPNGTDSDPKNYCVGGVAGFVPAYGSFTYNNYFKDSDCDGDGISNDMETNASGVPIDTDGDGIPNYLDTDSDNDGILDYVERNIDSDGDKVADYQDLDSDNDGISDKQEGIIDIDKDGIPNYLDLDSDGDILKDAWEAIGVYDTNKDDNYDGRIDKAGVFIDKNGNGWADVAENLAPTDTDKDGTPDYLDLDSDNDCIPDGVELTDDMDKDFRQNYRDIDSDGDSIPDVLEAVDCFKPIDTDNDKTPDYVDLDSDNDGMSDLYEAGKDGLNPLDSDKDGTPDFKDTDSDNDSIPDKLEIGPDGNAPLDSDQDGIPNHLDLDSDGDTIPDNIEAGVDGNIPADTDNDGTPDYLDLDTDSDGISDKLEAGSVGTSPLDIDKDGTPNFRDLDSDNDTIPDFLEAGSNNLNPLDSDKDGAPDYIDTDSDNDTIPDKFEAGLDGNNPVDTDGDGFPDYRDLDSDDDGTPDFLEAGPNGNNPIDSDNDGTPDFRDLDSDNDGISDKIEKGNNGNTPLDTDGDGTPDYIDNDSDNDSIPDSLEAGTNLNAPADTDKDGTPDFRDLDSDNDTYSDKIEAGSNGNAPLDTDKDGTHDFRDLDSDNDGILDKLENDIDFGGLPDCDGDGVDNRIDADPCKIFTPQGISPNNDGKNDALIIPGILSYKNKITIFNRYGNIVYEQENYQNNWNGTSNKVGPWTGPDNKLPDGTYYYVIDFFGIKPTISTYIYINRMGLK